jgi:hypothetical protein
MCCYKAIGRNVILVLAINFAGRSIGKHAVSWQ